MGDDQSRGNQLAMLRRALMYASLVLVSGSAFFLLRNLAWSNRLEEDFSASYACCTQQTSALFHARFWSGFFLAAKFGIAGCAGLAFSLRSRTACKLGIWTLSVGAGLSVCCFPMIHSGWFGAASFTLAAVVFCSGLLILVVASVRLAWDKFHRNRNTA